MGESSIFLPLVDISHGVPAFNVFAGALTLGAAYRYFPAGTVHVAVVDPGVGSARRPILVEAAGQFFVGPDNGIFGEVYASSAARESEGQVRVRHVTASQFFLHPVSQTFHGRDIFARVAGHLAAGVEPAAFGDEIDDYLRMAAPPVERAADGGLRGRVLAVDHFGNVITNIRNTDVPEVAAQGVFSLEVAGRAVSRTRSSYADAAEGEVFAILGSSGYWEISANRASASELLGVGCGDEVVLRVG